MVVVGLWTVFFFIFWCGVFSSLFLFLCCFVGFMAEGWLEMPVHAKKGAPPLTFGCGLGRECPVVDLGFFGRL